MGVSLSINDIRSVTTEMARYDGMNYSGYNFSFLKRRLGYVFSELRVRKLPQFIERLSDESFRESVKYYMAVNVTEMFRDPGFWRSLRANVFPLLRKKEWRVWFPDISSGEEVYSLAVLLYEDGLLDQVDIAGHHPSVQKCREVSEGILNAGNNDLNYSNYKRIENGEGFENFFSCENGQTKLRSDLLEHCRFSPRWFTQFENSGKFELIMFRNTGINFTAQRWEDNLKMVVEHLVPGGIIAIGVKESVPGSMKNLLVPVDRKESIYRKPESKNN
ncbi:MAG: CheR family methyltransferase [Marinilabilia sp.]